MISKWGWQLVQLSRELWVRTVAYAVLALFTAFIAIAVQSLIPEAFANLIGAGAAEKILTILASSMLTVTTFSLSVMIAAFSASTNSVSPRATRLLMQDSTTQNALATFIGSFLFSIVSIILLNARLYDERGEVVLFLATILVVVLIVITILVWINHLSGLGRVGETANRVEDEAYAALLKHNAAPWFKAKVLQQLADIPADAKPVLTDTIGYLQHIDIKALNNWASANDCQLYVVVRPGVFVEPSRPIFWHTARDNELVPPLKAFTIRDYRTFDQDPRFGLLVLAEIACKALSPAINDPGTAIEVLGRGMRVLSNWQPEQDNEVEYPHVSVMPLLLSDLFEDFFTPIARDGAAIVEIQVRLQKSLLALAQRQGEFRQLALQHSAAALARAEHAMAYPEDVKRLEELHKRMQHGKSGAGG